MKNQELAMSHVFGLRITTVISVVVTLPLLLIYSVHCIQETFGPSMTFLTSIHRTNLAFPTSENPYSFLSRPGPINIYLEKQPGYSVLVPLVTNKLSANADDIFEERGTVDVGTFTVEAPFGYGIIAVIQTLDLGGLEFDHKVKRGSCKNYIKFSDGSGSETDQICGRMLPYDKQFRPQGLIGSRTFVSPTGKIIVSFKFGDYLEFMTRHKLYQTFSRPSISTDDIDNDGPFYELSVSFTAFNDCHTEEPESVIPCVNNQSTNASCINVGLLCDNVFNCGFEDDFGYDEKYCTAPKGTIRRKGQTNAPNSDLPKSLIYYKVRPVEDYEEQTLKHESIYNPLLESNPNYTNYKYNPSLDRILQYNLSPASTILLIVITVVCIMILGIIIRFCCRKCVGTPLPVPNTSGNTDIPFSSSAAIALGSNTMLRDMNVDIQRSPYQCSRRNYELDLPPSYDELFPSSKLHSSISFIDISATEDNQPGSSELVKVPEGN